jgi:type I restriction enzyme S subunit
MKNVVMNAVLDKEVERAPDQSLKRAKRLRQSILKRAFEGKLAPQDPSDEPASVLLERIKAEKAWREGERKGGKRSRKRKQSRQLELLTP